MWDGTDLTLGCSYTNDVDLNFDASLVISRVDPETLARTNVITYTLFSGGQLPMTIVCTDNWADACPANMRQDDKFNYGDNDNLRSGSLVVTRECDESVETGFYGCRLNTSTTTTFAPRFHFGRKCDIIVSDCLARLVQKKTDEHQYAYEHGRPQKFFQRGAKPLAL